MATEFEPVTRKPIIPDPTMRNEPMERRSGFGMIGIFAGLVVAIALGLLFWNMNDRLNTATINTAPGVTTGSSSTVGG